MGVPSCLFNKLLLIFYILYLIIDEGWLSMLSHPFLFNYHAQQFIHYTVVAFGKTKDYQALKSLLFLQPLNGME